MLAKREEKKLEQSGEIGDRRTRTPEQAKKDERVLSLMQENENLRKALESERARRVDAEEQLKKAGNSRTVEVSKDREVQRLQGQIARMQAFVFHLKNRTEKKKMKR